MISPDNKKFKEKVERYISSGRLHDAINAIKDLGHRSMAWEVTDQLARTEEAYAFMLKYVAEGIDDPDRSSVYEGIVTDIYAALDALIFFKEKSVNSSQYFSTCRTFEKTVRQPIAEQIRQWVAAADKRSIFSILSESEDKDKKPEEENRRDMERMQAAIFTTVWTTPLLRAADAEAIGEALADLSIAPEFKIHLISAVTLGLLERFDARRLQLLMDAYMNLADINVTSAALIGLLLGLWRYSSRPLPRKLANRLAAVKEVPSWASDLKIAFLEMIRARDTERINRKIRDEVIPDMMKLKPDIMGKINESDLGNLDMASMEENPEWQELLDKSGITDKLKELTEMQMDGGDVMMGTFSHLKSFPFFYDIANWFLPFSASNSYVSAAASKLGVMSDMIENASFLCDSDKYSFMFALGMVPEDQRKLMTSQFQAQSDNIYEAMSEAAGMTSPEARKKAVNRYMQNIYRFFKLYRRKDDFFDPFNEGINLSAVPSLADDFTDVSLLEVVAEFYFKLGYMREAYDVFQRIDQFEDVGTAQRYQKMGYCCEKMGRYQDAIEFYHKAELLDQQAAWTLRRLAACYRAVGNTQQSIRYYQQLTAINPDDLGIALLLGYVLLESGDYQEALMQFYKVEFLDEASTKSWRPLAWTLFLNRDFATSKKYYDKILGEAPNANDYLNMGHVALASGDMKAAVNSYLISVEKRGGDKEAFVKSMKDDTPSLIKAGVKAELIPLITDAVLVVSNQ